MIKLSRTARDVLYAALTSNGFDLSSNISWLTRLFPIIQKNAIIELQLLELAYVDIEDNCEEHTLVLRPTRLGWEWLTEDAIGPMK